MTSTLVNTKNVKVGIEWVPFNISTLGDLIICIIVLNCNIIITINKEGGALTARVFKYLKSNRKYGFEAGIHRCITITTARFEHLVFLDVVLIALHYNISFIIITV